MDPVRNPYTPGAGSRPPALTGRDGQLDAFRIHLERLRVGRPEKSLIVTGLRGVGKTVLLNTFESAAENLGFKTAASEVTHEIAFRSTMARLSRRLLLAVSPLRRMKKRALTAAGVLKAFSVTTPDGAAIALDVEVLSGRGDSGDLGDDLSDLFEELGAAARDHGTGVAFFLDEIQFLDRGQLEALIAAIHRVTQKELPLTLVGAGLPQLPALAGTAKSYAERLFEFPRIGALDPGAARAALEVPAQAEDVVWEPAALTTVVDFTERYPYFLQEYGKHAWNYASGTAITIDDVRGAQTQVQHQLDENFFRVRAGRVSSGELRYLAAMAELGRGPQRSGEIATRLGKTGPEQVAPVRSRLIQKGLIGVPPIQRTR